MDDTTTATNAPCIPKLSDYFPTDKPREKQLKALDFIQRAVDGGYRDIVISAPTGTGKSFIGSAACYWVSDPNVRGLFPVGSLASGKMASYGPGGFYLVTQKMLQDQLERDFPHFKEGWAARAALLKSAVEYPCVHYGNCMIGGLVGPVPGKGSDGEAKTGSVCPDRREKPTSDFMQPRCPYKAAVARFARADVAITNYPYFFTERTFVRMMQRRRLLVADECHGIERQVLGFVELSVTHKTLEEWAPTLRPVPELKTKEEFCQWITETYLPKLYDQAKLLEDSLVGAKNLGDGDGTTRKLQNEYQRLVNHLGRIELTAESLTGDPDNWVYWQEYNEETSEPTAAIAKPLSAVPFVPKLITDNAALRIYMSAYPGTKDTFCRSLGLNPTSVAWLGLSSIFPVSQRPVMMTFVGSMGRKYQQETMPRLLRAIERIFKQHEGQKGIIHGHSYAICNAIAEHIANTPYAPRLLYAKNADERTEVMKLHALSKDSVLLSPSMTEGFDLKDDLSRFQVIAKVPYPYLGDPQIQAKKERDPRWYILQTVMTVLQACGRSIRNENDFAYTYILDADFNRLIEEFPEFFPKWFSDSFVWPKTK